MWMAAWNAQHVWVDMLWIALTLVPVSYHLILIVIQLQVNDWHGKLYHIINQHHLSIKIKYKYATWSISQRNIKEWVYNKTEKWQGDLDNKPQLYFQSAHPTVNPAQPREHLPAMTAKMAMLCQLTRLPALTVALLPSRAVLNAPTLMLEAARLTALSVTLDSPFRMSWRTLPVLVSVLLHVFLYSVETTYDFIAFVCVNVINWLTHGSTHCTLKIILHDLATSTCFYNICRCWRPAVWLRWHLWQWTWVLSLLHWIHTRRLHLHQWVLF